MPPYSKTSTAADLLPAALNILNRWETENLSLDDLLDDAGQTLPPRIRSGVTSLLMTLFRHRGAAESMISSLGMKIKARFHRPLLLAVIQCHWQQGIPAEAVADMTVSYAAKRFGKVPAGLLNAALRRLLLLNPADFPDTLPMPLQQNWIKTFGAEKTIQLQSVILNQPEFTFRTLFQAPLPESLNAVEIQTDFIPEKSFYTVRARDLFASELLESGRIYIQDPSTFLPIDLLLRNQIKSRFVLDACAAPGGKSLLLAEFLSPERLTAADRSAVRQQRTRENIENRKHLFPKTQFKIEVTEPGTAPRPLYDLLFLDVPCSNTGVFKRRPDAMWRFNDAKVSELVILQREILETQSQGIIPGGHLLYSTCSLEPKENIQQIQNFCKNHPDFSLLDDFQLFPSKSHDGSYAALLRKK